MVCGLRRQATSRTASPPRHPSPRFSGSRVTTGCSRCRPPRTSALPLAASLKRTRRRNPKARGWRMRRRATQRSTTLVRSSCPRDDASVSGGSSDEESPSTRPHCGRKRRATRRGGRAIAAVLAAPPVLRSNWNGHPDGRVDQVTNPLVFRTPDEVRRADAPRAVSPMTGPPRRQKDPNRVVPL